MYHGKPQLNYQLVPGSDYLLRGTFEAIKITTHAVLYIIYMDI